MVLFCVTSQLSNHWCPLCIIVDLSLIIGFSTVQQPRISSKYAAGVIVGSWCWPVIVSNSVCGTLKRKTCSKSKRQKETWPYFPMLDFNQQSVNTSPEQTYICLKNNFLVYAVLEFKVLIEESSQSCCHCSQTVSVAPTSLSGVSSSQIIANV